MYTPTWLSKKVLLDTSWYGVATLANMHVPLLLGVYVTVGYTVLLLCYVVLGGTTYAHSTGCSYDTTTWCYGAMLYLAICSTSTSVEVLVLGTHTTQYTASPVTLLVLYVG